MKATVVIAKYEFFCFYFLGCFLIYSVDTADYAYILLPAMIHYFLKLYVRV